MNYLIPNMNLNDVLKFSEEINSIIPDEEMILDFSKMHKFDPLPMLMIGSIIREYRFKHSNIPFKVMLKQL